MYKIDLEGFATFNDVYIQTYALEQEVLEQDDVLYLEPADLESESDAETDAEYSEDGDDPNDEDFIPNILDDSEDDDEEDDDSSEEDDGSNKHYLYSQVKRMQTQITAILGYLSKSASASANSIESYGGI